MCDGLSGRLSTSKTWNLPRYLIDPTRSRTETCKTIETIMHKFQGSEQSLITALRDRYLPEVEEDHLPDYTGAPNLELDKAITTAEVRAALLKLRRNTTPGKDKITNKALVNLDDTSIKVLTDYMNECWADSHLPKEWKEAEVRLLPKPGKTPCIDNLRPISLTSCVGKLMEHVVLQRLQNYLENTDRIPHTMFGFRPKLSTQDILLQLKKEIFETASKDTPKAILTLDLKGAFDNVAHTAILRNLASLDCGERTYGYIKDFLTAREAILKVGDLQSDPHKYGSRGTPQGAVLSPILFNIAMINLPAKLGSIPDIKHGLYADDITIWIAKGSAGEMQEKLQQAADIVHKYAKECTLLRAAKIRTPAGAKTPS